VTDAEITSVAAALAEAIGTLKPVPLIPAMTKPEASRIKREMQRLLSGDASRPLIGYKMSMSYTWGSLYDGDAMPSEAQIDRSRLFDPLIETEAVFYLDEDIRAGMALGDVLARCRVGAGIEVADCRWEGWCPSTPARMAPITPEMIEADNALARFVVLDSRTVPADSMSWPGVVVDARRDGKVVASGSLDHVVGHPANAVLWVARQLAKQGDSLKQGQFVSTGNPYRQLVTLPCGERGQFESVLHGVGTAAAQFI
jgi:2-keto-4-pentenoate hydratase